MVLSGFEVSEKETPVAFEFGIVAGFFFGYCGVIGVAMQYGDHGTVSFSCFSDDHFAGEESGVDGIAGGEGEEEIFQFVVFVDVSDGVSEIDAICRILFECVFEFDGNCFQFAFCERNVFGCG